MNTLVGRNLRRDMDGRWWQGLLLVIFMGAVFRFTGFNFGLPYYYDIDEPWLFYEAAFQRGLISWWDHPNPSPGLITVLSTAQITAEKLTGRSSLENVPTIILALRVLSIVVSLITLALIGLCARELAGNLAGWLAALLWALIPLVIYHSFIAIAEPWMMFFEALSLYTAAMTLRRQKIGVWAPLISVVAGLLAFSFKYSMFPFAGIGLIAVLWRAALAPIERRKFLKIALLQVITILVFLVTLVFLAGLAKDVSAPNREIAVFLKNPLSKLSDINNVLGIFGVAFWQFGMVPLMFGASYLVALVLLVRSPDEGRGRRLGLWILFAALGSFSGLLVPLYLVLDLTIARYLFAASQIFVILAAGSLTVIYQTLRRLSVIKKHPLLLQSGAGALVLLWLGSLAVPAISQAVDRTHPYTLTDMTIWASNTLAEGSIVTEGAASRVFQHEFGGYTGLPRHEDYSVDLLAKSPEEWQQNGFRYVEMYEGREQKLRQTEQGTNYLNQLLELRRFPPPDSPLTWTGLHFVIYQFQRPQLILDTTFDNNLRLFGVDGLKPVITPGEEMSLSFYWRARQKPDTNYSLFLHLEPTTRETLVAQSDGAPGPIYRPTLTWDVPSETLISKMFKLKIPETTPPGKYRLLIGLYDPVTGQRLTSNLGKDTLLAMIEVSQVF